MDYILLSKTLSPPYWLFLILIVLLIIGVSVYFFLKNRKFHVEFIQTISAMVNQMNELEYCRISNLADSVQILKQGDYPLIHQAGDKLREKSERLYQRKWIAEPSEILRLDNVLNKSQYRSTTGEIAIQILSFSVLASAMFILFGLSLTQNRSEIMQSAFIPLLVGAVFSFVLFFQSLRAKQDLNRSLTLLSESISEKVPVFRELAGTAALIESFFQYDRQMTKSITQLTQSVEDLSNHQLSKHLAENVKLVMQNEVVPPLATAINSLEDYINDLSIRQEDGMRALAQEFTANVSISLEEKLKPFYEEITALTRDLFEANKQLEFALDTMDNYKKQSLDIQDGLHYNMQILADARQALQADLSVSKDAIRSLASTSEGLAKLQYGNESSLQASLEKLSDKMFEFQSSIQNISEGLRHDTRENAKSTEELSRSNSQTLADMRQLSAVLIEQSDYIARQSQAINNSLESLETTLDGSIQVFSTQLMEGVHSTLNSFDEGLAEVTDRLSNTTADINATVDYWADELRYQNNRRPLNSTDMNTSPSPQHDELMRVLNEDTSHNRREIIEADGKEDTNLE